MWNKPWKYREGIAISIGLLVTGALLQISVGPVEWLIFMWPANIIALIALVVILGLFYTFRSKLYLFRFMTQVEAAVPALATASILTIIMGLSRQVPEGRPAMDPIGLSRMLSFWPFVLIYLWNVIIVAEVGIHQLMHFQKRFIPSLISHLGLFIFVTCGTLGSADMQRLKIYCASRYTAKKVNLNGVESMTIKKYMSYHLLLNCRSSLLMSILRNWQYLIVKLGKYYRMINRRILSLSLVLLQMN